MPRPKKCRKVCRMPIANIFAANAQGEEAIVLTVDEYECIRLLDYRGFSQEQCAEKMQVSRASVQLTYDAARKKIAKALVEGRTLRIEGGDFRLCKGEEDNCDCGGCQKNRDFMENANEK